MLAARKPVLASLMTAWVATAVAEPHAAPKRVCAEQREGLRRAERDYERDTPEYRAAREQLDRCIANPAIATRNAGSDASVAVGEPAELPAEAQRPPPRTAVRGCERACVSDGACSRSTTLVGDDYPCIAGSDDDCRASKACARDGRCTWYGDRLGAAGICIAANDDDCRGAAICRQRKRCTAYNNKCQPSIAAGKRDEERESRRQAKDFDIAEPIGEPYCKNADGSWHKGPCRSGDGPAGTYRIENWHR